MRNVAVLPPVKNELRAALLNLTAFKNFSTDDLMALAHAVPGGTKIHIPDRLTAIALPLGTCAAGDYGRIFPRMTFVVRTCP
jgi:hypothetical protein